MDPGCIGGYVIRGMRKIQIDMTDNFAMKYASQICYSSRETLQHTWDCAKYVDRRKMEGDFVECGVAAGAQIIAMLDAAPGRIVHAFDSFQGIPLPSNRDDQMPGIRKLTTQEIADLPDPGKQVLESTLATVVPEFSFYNHVYSAFPGRKSIMELQVWPGWFEETLPVNNLDKISLLRLDGDLYNSTYVCLDNLFHKVVKGGIVIIDDWELPGCKAACWDYFKKIGYKPRLIFGPAPVTHFFK